MATGEPFVDQYFARRHADIATPDNDDNWRINDLSNVARRADIALVSNSLERQPNAVLIDVTFAAHNAQTAGPDYTAGLQLSLALTAST